MLDATTLAATTRSVSVITDWYANEDDFAAEGEILLAIVTDFPETRALRDSGDLKSDEYVATLHFTTLAALNAASDAASRVTLGDLMAA